MIVKRAGHSEEYDERKLYASIYASMVATHNTVPAAEQASQFVQQRVEKWLEQKHEVTSNDIRHIAGSALKALNPDAAYQYLHHRVVW